MDDIKQKILGLMAKTTSNGCSEAEAMAASAKVQELLNKYQLSLSDIKLKESKCITGSYDYQKRVKGELDYVINAIGHFTDTKCWSSLVRYEGKETLLYKYFGLEHDVMIAEYITKLVDWAIIYGGEDFKLSDQYNSTPKGSKRSGLLWDFRYGMALRVAKRLREMKDAQKMANASSGRDLVVVKSAIVKEEFAKLNLGLRASKGGTIKNVNAAAYHAGAAAGDKVSINPGVQARRGESPQIA